MRLTEKALQFAQRAHEQVGQKRKYTGEAYIVHPLMVARIVSTVSNDEDMLAAALLHDVLEDTTVTRGDLELEFNPRVVQLVVELTDVSTPADGNRAVRKALDRAAIANASPEAQTIKLADLIHNTQTIVQHDPNFARVYLREKEELLAVLTKGDPRLRQIAQHMLESSYAILKGEPHA